MHSVGIFLFDRSKAISGIYIYIVLILRLLGLICASLTL